MRLSACALAFLLPMLAACGSESKDPAPAAKPTLDQTSPRALAESIFAIAKDGDLALLAPLVDPVDADGDSKQVAAIGQAPADRQAGFRAHFGPGKVSGEVKEEGDQAAVPILFGPDGTKPETFNMVRRDGRWYLRSF